MQHLVIDAFVDDVRIGEIEPIFDLLLNSAGRRSA